VKFDSIGEIAVEIEKCSVELSDAALAKDTTLIIIKLAHMKSLMKLIELAVL
jgi:hypothetical protein